MPFATQLQQLSPESLARLQGHLVEAGKVLVPTSLDKVTFNINRDAGAARLGIQLDTSNPWPSVFMNTLPKSGSLFCRGLLLEQLELRHVRLAGGYFPADTLFEAPLSVFHHGGAFAQEHVPATTINLELLNRHLERIVIHVRDPRQATISWVHHLERLRTSEREQHALRLVDPPLPEDYFDRDFEARVQWNLDHHLTACVDWLEGWRLAATRPQRRLKIHFSEFRVMKSEPERFFAELFDFHGIDCPDFRVREANPDMSKEHFRKGRTNEWREVLTPTQVEQANAAMTDGLCERFGWER